MLVMLACIVFYLYSEKDVRKENENSPEKDKLGLNASLNFEKPS